MSYACAAVAYLILSQGAPEGVVSQPFAQEIRTLFTVEKGLPKKSDEGESIDDVLAIALTPEGQVRASVLVRGANLGILRLDATSFTYVPHDDYIGRPCHSYLAAASGLTYYGEYNEDNRIVAAARVSGEKQLYAWKTTVFEDVEDKRNKVFTTTDSILSLAATFDGAAAVGTDQGLYLRPRDGADFAQVYPADKRYSWAPRTVAAVAYDSRGRLWFGCGQGAGVLDGETWTLYTGAEGLPYDHFTCAAGGEDGVIWFGTERGAIRFDGKHWSYRASLRWLPNDHVHDIAVAPDGTAWIATAGGISCIKREKMTLAKKADYFVDQVETRHNRDGYITNWNLTTRGDVSTAVPGITDNDGMYTAMYGASMALRYAVTGDAEAKRLATRSLLACKFLEDVVPDEVNGVDMRGFVARVVIPVDWHEPVNEEYGPEYNASKQKRDPFWKQITPRFPLSTDGKYRWKNDTSSDELAGHFFFYGIYYDLVAKTEEEKAPVREAVRDITDHLIRNGFNLIDHDGKPTRWGRFGPDYVETVYGWDQRGLNSMMMLSMLAVAEHVTGDAKYGETAKMLRDKHKYHISAMYSRSYFPPSDVVPWDNNLALLSFYGLIRYENDPELLLMYRLSLEHCWLFASKQKNALWNLIYGACAEHVANRAAKGFFDKAFPEAGPLTAHRVRELSKYDQALGDTLDSLRGLPLELIGWDLKNSHRLDVELDNTPGQEPAYGWSRVDGKALPIEERGHVRQDRDAFMLNLSEGSGWDEHEGTFYLLPYWLALHHGFLE